MEKAMKYCRTRALFNKLKEFFHTTIQPLEKHFIVFTLEYSLYTSDERKISKEKLVSLFKEQLNKEDIMTIAKRIEQQGIQRGIQEGIQRGREEGIQRGREEGIQRGREEGIQRGREEGILETAKNLIQQGIPLDVISKATGLSKKELAQLS
jgi:flagellar biosynthesis/type III secretory pathway protein FliH